MRATELLAVAHGRRCEGSGRCFYCGAPAGAIPLKLSDAFTDWWSVADYASRVICAGCEIALDEKVPIAGREKPQKTRSWSWLITEQVARPLMDIAAVRAACLSPPEGRWALAIAVSGQKHLIYRAPVNLREPFSVQLELQAVTYHMQELRDRLALAKRIAAATGKPALTAQIEAGTVMRLLESLPESDVDDWFSRAAEPLSVLAAFICPSKQECLDECAAAT